MKSIVRTIVCENGSRQGKTCEVPLVVHGNPS